MIYKQLYNLTITMGGESSKLEIFPNLQTKIPNSIALSLPLNSHSNYEVHELHSHSPQQHQKVLQRIRCKKNNQCPYIVRIIDSHTVQSYGFCSTMIKTYVMVEKLKDLGEECQNRKRDNLWFKEEEMWNILYSCCMGLRFLLESGIKINHLSLERIYFGDEGQIKIFDPELTQGFIPDIEVPEVNLLQDIGVVLKSIIDNGNNQYYSLQLRDILQLCGKGERTIQKVLGFIEKEFFQNSFPCHSSPAFSLRPFQSNTKKKVLSLTVNGHGSEGRKVNTKENNFMQRRKIVSSSAQKYKLKSRVQSSMKNKGQKQNCNMQGFNNDFGLFTFKDPLKNINLDEKILNQKSSVLETEESLHKFPQKAVLSQQRQKKNRKKNQLDRVPLKELVIKQSSSIVTSETSQKEVKIQHKEIEEFTHQINRDLQSYQTNQTDKVVLENSISKKVQIQMISYQVDQETSVCEFSRDQNSYLLELINKSTELCQE